MTALEETRDAFCKIVMRINFLSSIAQEHELKLAVDYFSNNSFTRHCIMFVHATWHEFDSHTFFLRYKISMQGKHRTNLVLILV